jgi:adenine/guanine phosphoribosyltransferase-like PRPP-binding protein
VNTLNFEKRFWDHFQVLYGLRLILEKYRSTRELYMSINNFFSNESDFHVSYSQFTRYLTGQTKLSEKKMAFFESYLLQELKIVPDLLIPRLDIDIHAHPIQVDLTELLSSPSTLNFLAYFLCHKENLYSGFDVILTHSEAVPLAIGFSQILNIPWYSVSYRPPSSSPDHITRYPYLIDQELVSTLYFNHKRPNLKNKRVLIISDYVRKGGLLDILFRVVEDNSGEVPYLMALIGIGLLWKRLFTELQGRQKVLYLLSQ